MGGQACIFYGGSEFTRDLDLAILADTANLNRLRAALAELDAHQVAVPELSTQRLDAGHAVHFRCRRLDIEGLRIDVMSKMRGVAAFEDLWSRRSTIEIDGQPIDVLSLPDLVLAKKTQRDKYWPMIRRLVEQDYFARSEVAKPHDIDFWLRELRTADLLVLVASLNPEKAKALAGVRPAVASAITGGVEQVNSFLRTEEAVERERDHEYWAPLRLELEQARRERR